MTTNHATRNAAAWAKIRAAAQLTAPQADFMSCMLSALFAAMPAFLAGLMDCLGGGDGEGSDDYNPGNRGRCGN